MHFRKKLQSSDGNRGLVLGVSAQGGGGETPEGGNSLETGSAIKDPYFLLDKSTSVGVITGRLAD